MSPHTRAIAYLVFAAFIWGLSFPIGRYALDTITPLALAGLRYFFGALALLPLAWRWRRRPALDGYLTDDQPWLWLKGGALGGTLLAVGSIFQLNGLAHTTAGMAGFLSTLYLSLVPVMAFVLGHLPRALVWAGLAVGLGGLYLLAGGSGGHFSRYEGMILIADVFWAVQVLVTGIYALKVNPWLFSLAQSAVCSALTLMLAAVLGDLPTWPQFVTTLPATAWGVLSVGVAYSCQTLAQRHTSAASAALILPFQAVVGAVAGVIFLGEVMSATMIWGAAILMGGSLLAQFAKEPIRLNRENCSKLLMGLRVAVGGVLVAGTAGLLVWAFV